MGLSFRSRDRLKLDLGQDCAVLRSGGDEVSVRIFLSFSMRRMACFVFKWLKAFAL